MTMINSRPEKMNLSFSGCGFLCIYHAGVAAAIKEYAPQLAENRVSGASAGAIVAAGLICGVCISQATSTILRIVTQARARAMGPLHPAFNLLGLVREEIVRTLPSDAYKRCNNRLAISLTRWSDKKNVVVSEYSSNEELIDVIICSCFIPVYCGVILPKYRGVAYIDGGFTDNQPVHDDHTVTVSPFSGESDICPPDSESASFFGVNFSGSSIRFTTRNLFRITATLMPPSTEDCSKMCLQGFEDGLRFLTRNAMAPCIRCLTIQTNAEPLVDSLPTSPTPSEDRTLLVPPVRIRKRSASNRRRIESECETCCESDHQYTTEDVFPKIMRRTFDDAVAAENPMLKYLLSFRVFRYAHYALRFSKLPYDVLIVFSKNLLDWVKKVAAPQWVVERINSIIEFIAEEIEEQKLRFSSFGCQLALTEEYQRPSSSKELPIELSEEAKKELDDVRKRDGLRHQRSHSSGGKSTSTVSREWSYMDGGEDDVDSLQHVIEYTNNHDSMYAFHYMDDNNKLRTFELFNMSDPKKKHSCHPTTSHASPTTFVSRPVSVVLEEELEKDEEEENPVEFDAKREEMDSGLSGVEANQTDNGRRDACCSPVRYPSSSGSTRSNSFRNKQRRQASTTSSHSASRRHAAIPMTTVSPSSDSETDPSDGVFKPARRHRHHSNDYDGEPEPSDNDAPV